MGLSPFCHESERPDTVERYCYPEAIAEHDLILHLG